MNSRRFIRSPRRQARAACRGRSVLRSLEVDDQAAAPASGTASRLRDPSDVDADLAVRVRHAGSIANQPASYSVLAVIVGSRTTTALPSLLRFP
jgi:hypothetical protein